MPNRDTFAGRLRTLREAAGLTVLQLARRANVERTYLHALESGDKAAPSFDIVCRLAAALDCSTEDFRPQGD